ncbi:MAG: glycosyltransferase family 2 protein [Syntrophomonas sp.]
MTERILIGTTVRQKPGILQEFLQSLAGLEYNEIEHDYFFFNNNDQAESIQLLRNFLMPGSNTFLAEEPPHNTYQCTDETHNWTVDLIWRVAAYKDYILQFGLEKGYSHIFLVDSDLVLHPSTLQQLLVADTDIISEVFWTEWMPGTGRLPQVWMWGQYGFVPGLTPAMDKDLYQQEAVKTIARLQTPGIFEVGGLGACTLISRKAIESGVSFARINNVDYWGEDRHFCIRAAVLGFKLYVDTYFPAFHIYREADLNGVEEYKEACRKNIQYLPQHNSWRRKANGNTVTLSMIVRNEAGRYLQQMLEHARRYIDRAVIIDDASTDQTSELCRNILQGIPLTLVELKESSFNNEYLLRKRQWEETIKTDPDWILALDGDEIFEDRIATEIGSLINQTEFDAYCFRLYDFWDQKHYREDTYWCAHKVYRPFLLRYVPGFPYRWRETAQHCGRIPENILELPYANSHLRVKHFGWAREEDRREKYERYMKLDPGAVFGIQAQYQSILDAGPTLVEWKEKE